MAPTHQPASRPARSAPRPPVGRRRPSAGATGRARPGPSELQRRLGNRLTQRALQEMNARRPSGPTPTTPAAATPAEPATATGPSPAPAPAVPGGEAEVAPIATAPTAGPVQAGSPEPPGGPGAAAGAPPGPDVTEERAQPPAEGVGGAAEVQTPTGEGAGEVAGVAEGEAAERGAEPSAEEAVAPAAAAVAARARQQRGHRPPEAAAANASAAAVDPGVEQRRSAAEATVEVLDADTAEVRRQEFKAALRRAIRDATPQPKTEDEAERVMAQGAAQANEAMRGQLTVQRDAAAGPMRSAASTEVDPASQPAPEAVDLDVEPSGPPPPPVPANPVVPQPLPDARVDYSHHRGETDEAMADAGITTEQLARGNEPAFAPALEARSEAEAHQEAAPVQYRESEAQARAGARSSATGALTGGLDAMFGERSEHLEGVGSLQETSRAEQAQERTRITERIDSIKRETRSAVESILDEMDAEAEQVFAAGLEAAEEAYDDAFEEAKGGIGTWLTTWGSDWDRHIEASLATARAGYLREVDKAIDAVADCVDAKLRAAKERVADGRAEVDAFVATLDEDVRIANEQAIRSASEEFDALEASIDERRDSLVNRLTEQYKASYQRMSEREQELREANKSLWQRVYDATVGVIEKIIEFKNLLAGALRKAASVITLIIDDPIGFLGNLVDAVSQGVENFKNNIGEHLKAGFLDWLFGTVAGAGIQMPRTFDMRGILDLVLQILGLTWQNIRRIAADMFGEQVVSTLERFAEPIVVLIREGPGGLWDWIKEKLSDLKQMFLDEVEDWLITKVVKAGIAWILSLMNPVSAFIKACMAIYDIVMFFVERARQVAELVHAVTDSVAEIAHGSIGGAAKRVEDALGNAIPVAIGLLASLLDLGDLTDTIKGFIDRIRQPVEKAIRWLIGKAVDLVKAAGKLLGIGKDQPVAEGDEHDAAVVAGLEFLSAEVQKAGGGADLVEADGVASRVKDAHPVFKKVEPVDSGDSWSFAIEASEVKNTVELPKEEIEFEVREEVESETIDLARLQRDHPNLKEWQIYEMASAGPAVAMMKERFPGRRAVSGTVRGDRRSGRSKLGEIRMHSQMGIRKGDEALGQPQPDYRTTISPGRGMPDEIHVFDPTLNWAEYIEKHVSVSEVASRGKMNQLFVTIQKLMSAARSSRKGVSLVHYTIIAPVHVDELPEEQRDKAVSHINEAKRLANAEAPPEVEITWAVVRKSR